MRISKFILAAGLVLAVNTGAFAAGAIAVDDDADTAGGDAGYGLVTGEDTPEDAAKAAMKQCKSSGNSSCTVVLRFDGCGAYASSKKVYGVGTGKTEADAQKKALEECGNKSCKVVVSDCE